MTTAECMWGGTAATYRRLPLEFAGQHGDAPIAFGEEIVAAVDRCHAVAQHALPLVFDALDLVSRHAPCRIDTAPYPVAVINSFEWR